MTSPTRTSDSPGRTRSGSWGLLLAAWVAGVGLLVLPALHGGPWVHGLNAASGPSHEIALDLFGSLEEGACPVCLVTSQARTGLVRAAAAEAAGPPANPLPSTDRTRLTPRRPARSLDPARAPPVA